MIQIVAVGKIKESSMVALIGEYVKRLSGYTKIQIDEVADEPNNNPHMDDKVRQIEGQRILARLKPHNYVILLDLKGKSLSSEQLAAKLQEIYTYTNSDISFVIGGSLGVSPEVKQKADFCWKLSDLTFPHNIARLLLVEQIYRSYRINNHEPYHK